MPRLRWTQSNATASTQWVDQLKTGREAPERMAGRPAAQYSVVLAYHAGRTSGRADAPTPRRRRCEATRNWQQDQGQLGGGLDPPTAALGGRWAQGCLGSLKDLVHDVKFPSIGHASQNFAKLCDGGLRDWVGWGRFTGLARFGPGGQSDAGCRSTWASACAKLQDFGEQAEPA